MEAIFGEFVLGRIERIARPKVGTSTIAGAGYEFVVVKRLDTLGANVPDHAHGLHLGDYLVGDLAHLDLRPVQDHVIQGLH
jgi:hypothetical protein